MASAKSKSWGSIVIIAILVLVVLGKRCLSKGEQVSDSENTVRANLLQHKLSYSKHAKCRMKCREISEEEVEHILEVGKLNAAKSELNQTGSNCPSYAFEGKTLDGQDVRIIFGDCPKTTKVITCIDLGKEHECDCP